MNTTGDNARLDVARAFKNYKEASDRVEFLRRLGDQSESGLQAMNDALIIRDVESSHYKVAQHALARMIAPVGRQR